MMISHIMFRSLAVTVGRCGIMELDTTMGGSYVITPASSDTSYALNSDKIIASSKRDYQ